MEIELKLLVNVRDAAALRQHPLLERYACSKPHEDKMSDTYFDTTELDVRRGHASLRVRRVNNNWIQTLKDGGIVNGGLHSRHELEIEVDGPVPAFKEIREIAGQKKVWGWLLNSPEIEDRLIPIFTTHVKRLVWECRLPQGDIVECVLDLGSIASKNLKAPISEIELELKSGDPTHLFDFALALLQDIPMQIGNFSKADRGYALYGLISPAAMKATPVKLVKHMNIEQAFTSIVNNCMAQIQSNASSVSRSRDAEYLHQMRVGLRKLQSALGLFDDVLQAPEELVHELDWLAEQLGSARDWYVLSESTLTVVLKKIDDEVSFTELSDTATDKFKEKYEAAAVVINSARYTALILSFTRWLLGHGWRDAMSLQDQERLTLPVIKYSSNALELLQHRLQKRVNKMRGASSKAHHRVRIQVKNMRYAIEFFKSLYPTSQVRPFVAALSFLQEKHGWLNDMVVGKRLLQELQAELIQLESSTNFIRGYLTSCIETDEKKLLKKWKNFTPMKFR